MSYTKIVDQGSIFENISYYKDEECTIAHREDGPACIYTNGTKSWYFNDSLHREDGPAVEYAGGSKAFYLNNVWYKEEDYWLTIRFGSFV